MIKEGLPHSGIESRSVNIHYDIKFCFTETYKAKH